MKSLLVLVVLVVVGIAGFGFYRGWFHFSQNGTEQQPNATVTLDKNKLREDERKAKDKAQGLEQEAKRKIRDWEGTAKEPQRQP